MVWVKTPPPQGPPYLLISSFSQPLGTYLLCSHSELAAGGGGKEEQEVWDPSQGGVPLKEHSQNVFLRS